MKTAKFWATRLCILCPYCKKIVKNPNHKASREEQNFLWNTAYNIPEIVKCDKCDTEFKTSVHVEKTTITRGPYE